MTQSIILSWFSMLSLLAHFSVGMVLAGNDVHKLSLIRRPTSPHNCKKRKLAPSCYFDACMVWEWDI